MDTLIYGDYDNNLKHKSDFLSTKKLINFPVACCFCISFLPFILHVKLPQVYSSPALVLGQS